LSVDSKYFECPDDVPAVYSSYSMFIQNGGQAADECRLDTLSFRYVPNSQSSDGNKCPETISRVYEIADMCGNIQQTTEIIILNDETKPDITCPDHMVIEPGNINDLAEFTGLPFSETAQNITLSDAPSLGIFTSDNCAVHEITYSDNISGFCPAIVTRTFTVYDDCGNSATCIQTIEISTVLIPEFDPIGPFCQNSKPPDLPAVSINGISGTWNPAIIETSTIGTAIYTFTPTDGQCATEVTIEIEIVNEITPIFGPVGPVCQYDPPPQLPSISMNGISGIYIYSRS